MFLRFFTTILLYVENIESLPYVKQIQLLSAQSQNSEEDSLSYELVIDINEELIGQEEAK